MASKERIKYRREVMAHVAYLSTEDYSMIQAVEGSSEDLVVKFQQAAMDGMVQQIIADAPALAGMMDALELAGIEAAKAAKFMVITGNFADNKLKGFGRG